MATREEQINAALDALTEVCQAPEQTPDLAAKANAAIFILQFLGVGDPEVPNPTVEEPPLEGEGL